MKCEFCREDIQDDALVCPHCRKKTQAGRDQASSKLWSRILIGLGVVVGLFVLAVMTGKNAPTPAERIAQGCEREFGADVDAVTRCKIELYAKEIEKQEAEKLKRAGSGL